MSEKKILLKTCSSCGQQKPLSAFLQLAGSQGGMYGHICASCRSAGLDKTPMAKEVEDASRTSTGLKIDAKTVLQREIDQKNQKLEVEERYLEEREEKDEKQSQQIERVSNKAQAEKDHRQRFIEKSSFLNRKPSNPVGTPPGSFSEVTNNEQRIDFSTPFIDTYISGKEKFKGTAIKSFLSSINKGDKGPKADKGQKLIKATNEKEASLSKKIEEEFAPPSPAKGPSSRR